MEAEGGFRDLDFSNFHVSGYILIPRHLHNLHVHSLVMKVSEVCKA